MTRERQPRAANMTRQNPLGILGVTITEGGDQEQVVIVHAVVALGAKHAGVGAPVMLGSIPEAA